MGIANLLQFLRQMQKAVNIKNYSGIVVAVDAMCWIHRGMISSAVANVTGDSCDKYLKFIISMIALLLSYNITPIMVFDGYDMPAKEEENNKRRERREAARSEALEMIRKNGGRVNTEIMRKCMQAIYITPEIINRVMSLCRKMGIQIVVAPYEADAEVAYLCRSGIASCAISEDSDLLAYGCPRVWYKLDKDGKAIEITLPFNNNLDYKVSKGFLKGMTHRMFVIMCVLSGTDYDDGNHIFGMGIKIAYKYVLEYNNLNDIIKSLVDNNSWTKKLPTNLSCDELILFYERVSSIFLHNIVYDITTDTLLHINPISPNDTFNKFTIILDIASIIKNKNSNFRSIALGLINPKDNIPFNELNIESDNLLVKDIQFKPLDILINQLPINTNTNFNLINHQDITNNTTTEVTTTVGPADSSSNYLSLKGDATPGDRGEGSEDVTSSGEPAADLREAKGEVNKEAVCKTTSGGDGRTRPQVESCLQDNEITSIESNGNENRVVTSIETTAYTEVEMYAGSDNIELASTANSTQESQMDNSYKNITQLLNATESTTKKRRRNR